MSKPESVSKLTRRPTWPALNLLTPSMSKGKPQSIPTHEIEGDIDEDPFSHFLSPILDDEDLLEDDDFSAGIGAFDDEEEEAETKRTNFRTRLGERWDNFLSRPKRPRTPPDEEEVPDLETDDPDVVVKSPQSCPPLCRLNMLEEELDGWEADRARQRRTFGFPLQRPKLKTSRTLSGKRHSYVEPSPALWTVDEDDETDTIRPAARGRGKLRHK